jgi:hypothetical protein
LLVEKKKIEMIGIQRRFLTELMAPPFRGDKGKERMANSHAGYR